MSSGRHTADRLNQAVPALANRIAHQLSSPRDYSLRPVINATGVILHTNLGRAPLRQAALDHLVEIAQDYCNLEIDLESGERSRRDIHAESPLLRALGIQNPAEYGVAVVN